MTSPQGNCATGFNGIVLMPALLALSATPASDLPKAASFYVGTYTSDQGSRGIYRAELDSESGAISTPTLVAETPSPSFLALHPTRPLLFAANESSGSLTAFAIAPEGGLRTLNSRSSLGDAPCHIVVDPSGRFVFVANYMGGNVVGYPIETDGSLGATSRVFQNVGSGPDRGRQEQAHMHFITFDRSGKFAYACDLGTDEILEFQFDPTIGKLKVTLPRAAMAPGGAGPRHLAFHPSGKFAYVNNEMGNNVMAFAVHPESGELRHLETVETLPKETSREGVSTAEIVVHPNGKGLYVSNRGADSLSLLEISKEGRLDRKQVVAAGVKGPRSFAIDPSGRWIVAAGQHSNDLVSLAINPDTGQLGTPVGHAKLSSPVCVLFGR